VNTQGKIMNLVYPNDKSETFSSATNISVRFIPATPMQLQIKIKTMKSVSIPNQPIIPSLFQIAAHMEDFALAQSAKTARRLRQMPFAGLMLHPEKLAAVLKPAGTGNNTAAATQEIGRRIARRAPRKATPKNTAICKTPSHSLSALKKTEFFLEAPSAKSVKLAADFTDWEKLSLDMTRIENGIWFAAVSLAPGNYSYRFIVDGQWHDDPRSHQCVPNPFGTANAMIQVL